MPFALDDVIDYIALASMRQITILDVGHGNLRSVEKALICAADAAGVSARVSISREPDALATADQIVFPGQGGFGECARGLQGGLEEALLEQLRRGKPYLGICLGLQVLFEGSDEAPGVPGLGWFPGRAQRLIGGGDIKIPHMGWNVLEHTAAPHPHLERAGSDWFYFVHSYHAVVSDESVLSATATHGPNRLTAVVARDNVFATQFHPEKSQQAGILLLSAFLSEAGR